MEDKLKNPNHSTMNNLKKKIERQFLIINNMIINNDTNATEKTTKLAVEILSSLSQEQ